MPRRQFIDKKTATTYALVHRAQNDPLIHSSDAPQMVFTEVSGPGTSSGADEDLSSTYAPSSSASASGQASRSKKVKQRGDLEDEFGISFRKNEGQAAEQGVYFDDTRYDYMQHMRDLGDGQGGGEVAWVPAATPSRQAEKGKGKGRMKLEDAIAAMGLEGDADSEAGGVSLSAAESGRSARSLMPEEMLGSEFVRPTTYQDMQDVPDAIAGFQPNMDPRLREVLEALEDEAYVDDDEDVFGELTGEAEEIDEHEFEGMFFGDDSSSGGQGRLNDFLDSQASQQEDDGWESDDTVRAGDEKLPKTTPSDQQPNRTALPPADPNATPAADPSNGAWLSEYSKFKQTLAASRPSPAADPDAPIAPSESADRSALSSLATGRRKKRKGARTSTTNYSMTSSALARTDQMSLLDERFDRLLTAYEADEYGEDMDGVGLDGTPEDASVASGVSGLSRASRASRVSKADSLASGVSRASGISTYSRATDSEAPKLVRSDFDNIMDGFLEGQKERGGKSRRDVGPIKNGRPKRGAGGEGLRELDEIRKGLGAARVR